MPIDVLGDHLAGGYPLEQVSDPFGIPTSTLKRVLELAQPGLLPRLEAV